MFTGLILRKKVTRLLNPRGDRTIIPWLGGFNFSIAMVNFTMAATNSKSNKATG